MLPKTDSGEVIVHNEDIAFLDPLRSECIQSRSNEELTDSVLSEFRRDRKMAQNSATAIVTTQNGADDLCGTDTYETQPVIPL